MKHAPDLYQRELVLKSCCAALYAGEWASLLLGDSYHPGGLALTDRLARLLRIDSASTVLDAACGRGTSALYLAQSTGCRVIGVDLSATNVARARAAAEEAHLGPLVDFRVADVERLPMAAGLADAVICECSFCVFPDKESAAAEFRRVLRPGGRLGLCDLTLNGALPQELETLAGWVACLAGAWPLERYSNCLQAAGFGEPYVEQHDMELKGLVDDLRLKWLGLEALSRLGKLELSDDALQQAKQIGRAAAAAVRDGRLGYSLFVAALVDGQEGL
jgi:SAM-dependent methyltransferase